MSRIQERERVVVIGHKAGWIIRPRERGGRLFTHERGSERPMIFFMFVVWDEEYQCPKCWLGLPRC